MKRLIVLCSALFVLAGCEDTLIQTELQGGADNVESLGLELVRSKSSSLPETVDRARLRVWNSDIDRTADVQIPAEGGSRSVSVEVPSGTYDVALVVYSDTYNEAYSFADTTGVEVATNELTNVSLDIGNVEAGPDYLLAQEIQVTPTTGDLMLDAFFTTPDMHPSLPDATLHYDPDAFTVPDSAAHQASMTPELDNYYVATLSGLSDPAFTDSVHFRVETPLNSAWGDSLRALAPSVAKGEDAYSAELGGGIVVTFVERSPAW